MQSSSQGPGIPVAKKVSLKSWAPSGDAKVHPAPALGEAGRVGSRRGSTSTSTRGLGLDTPGLEEVGRTGSRRGSTSSAGSGGSGAAPALGEAGKMGSKRGSARGASLGEGERQSSVGGTGGKKKSKRGALS
jgi:hypothetical protein